MGLAGTLISLLLVASVTGLLPDGRNIEDQGRARLAEVLAINSSIFITLSDLRRLESTHIPAVHWRASVWCAEQPRDHTQDRP